MPSFPELKTTVWKIEFSSFDVTNLKVTSLLKSLVFAKDIIVKKEMTQKERIILIFELTLFKNFNIE